MAYLTAAIAKSDWLNIVSDTTHDAMIGRMLADVVAEINSICMQPIEAVATTIYFDGNAKYFYNLPYTVPVTLTTLHERDTPVDTWTDLVAGDYALDTTGGISRIYNANWFLSNQYKAVLSVGYATADVPQDIAVCGYEMIKELFNETPFAPGGDRFGVSAVNVSDAGMSFSKAILAMRPKVEARLQPYRMLTL